MNLKQIIAFVRGTEEFRDATIPDQEAAASGDYAVLERLLEQRSTRLESIDQTRANSVREVLADLRNLR